MTRLSKHIALVLGISRREADLLIESGQVKVNGGIAILGQPYEKDTSVYVKGKEIAKTSELKYIALNKPKGYVCSRKQQDENPTVYSLLPPELHELKTVGRLDRDSSGIILLTNDGDFAHQMTHPKFSKVKIYEVQLDKPLEPLHQQMISDHGIQLEDGVSKFSVEKLSFDDLDSDFTSERGGTNGELEPSESKESKKVFSYRVTMSEGRNRQIRRTFDSLGYTVTKLHRIQFGNYLIEDLSPKQWREINI